MEAYEKRERQVRLFLLKYVYEERREEKRLAPSKDRLLLPESEHAVPLWFIAKNTNDRKSDRRYPSIYGYTKRQISA